MKIINILTLGVTILLSTSCESVFEYDADDRKNYDEIFSDYNLTGIVPVILLLQVLQMRRRMLMM